MKQFVKVFLILIISLFIFKTNVVAVEKHEFSNNINILKRYKVQKYTEKNIRKKVKKMLKDEENKKIYINAYKSLSKKQKKIINKKAGIKNVDDDKSLVKFAVYLHKSNLSLNNVKVKKNNNIDCSQVKILHSCWVVIEIAAPILVILLGSADFFTAVIAGDEKKMSEARKKFPKRLIAGVSVFLAFTIISIVCNLATNKSAQSVSLARCIVVGK